jgi:hypothetical protein
LLPLLLLIATLRVYGQSDPPLQIKWLLEDYSRDLFSTNAEGFMSPLVIVTNVGANDAFYNSAHVPKENRLYFDLSVRSMMASVRDDERTYTAILPTQNSGTPTSLREAYLFAFKGLLANAVAAGELEGELESATVFGGTGARFTIPKEYLLEQQFPGLDSNTINSLPDELALPDGTNQTFVIAAVPQLIVGSLYSTELMLRYIPPVVFDVNVGRVTFFGVGIKHAFTNWIEDAPFDAALQIGYQYSTIKNEVGLTKAKLEANTELIAFNLHASRRFSWIEPYVGLSYETLNSDGSYTFTLPQGIKEEIGYDIDPQKVDLALSDQALKGTLGVSAYVGPLQIFGSMGIAKHLIFSAGIGYRFNTAIELM